jgi:putative Mg2+ transporter-C (MgtC) family protein
MHTWSFAQESLSLQGNLIKLLISIILGGIIGWQREHTGHEAGIRTFCSICMGSCLFGIVSTAISSGDPGRIAAQVVSGIGFIGIGVIIRDGGSIKGLTTAATLWSTAAIGLAVAYNLYILSALSTALMFSFLFLSRTQFWHYIAKRPADHPNEVDPNYLHPFKARQHKAPEAQNAFAAMVSTYSAECESTEQKVKPDSTKKD